MPLVQTRGAASAQGFGEFAQQTAANYIEDVFSTYLYTGNSSTQTINNGIDLAGKGGLVWLKSRSAAYAHYQIDTVRGNDKYLSSNSTNAQATLDYISTFNSNGFGLNLYGNVNQSGTTYCSWTFREQAKFFDIVTYTGNGVTTGRTINHNLGSAPGMMILKVIDLAGDDWYVYHRSIPTSLLALNLTNGTGSPPTTPNTIFGNGSTTVAPTSTQVTIGGTANSNGYSYVLYLFAHDAGGFGATGTDNVISCGTFTTDGSGIVPQVNLGYEPQYILAKRTDTAQNWYVFDVMREWSMTNQRGLSPNTSGAEVNFTVPYFVPNATGFYGVDNLFGANASVIYMAIRRPMKVPTTGTSVYLGSLAGASVSISTGFVPDMAIAKTRDSASPNYVGSRLQGNAVQLRTSATAAEGGFGWGFSDNTNTFSQSSLGSPVIDWIFRRASGFMDVVCYIGNNTAGATQAHNLGVTPELIIIKDRLNNSNWAVYSAPTGNTNYLYLNSTQSITTSSSFWNNTSPTSTVFSLGNNSVVNGNPAIWGPYVAYLFATLAGVSKVGSYTGNGGTQAIACGFTGGARFVLIKRTDSTGDWYVYDTTRGMTTLTDPYITLNTNTAESATLGSVTTTTGGFTVDATILAAINTNAASYIFLAIA